MKNKVLKVYVSPLIISKEILLEKDLTQSSIPINPTGPEAAIKIYDWDELDNDENLIISKPDNSSWQ